LSTRTPTSGARLAPIRAASGSDPLAAWLDRGDGTGEALSGILRPGNAASNTAQDHRDVLAMALLALPKPARRQPIQVRCDSAPPTPSSPN
jgi:hypothetical protein